MTRTNNYLHGLLVLLGLFIFTAKSSAQQSVNGARITVIRNADESLAKRPMTVYIDGVKSCFLPNSAFTTFIVNEGEHTVFADLGKTKNIKRKIAETSLSIKVSPQQEYFVLMVVTDPKKRNITFTPILQTGAAKLMKEYRQWECKKP